eukprot:144707-Hanusia_phi.AAC.1
MKHEVSHDISQSKLKHKTQAHTPCKAHGPRQPRPAQSRGDARLVRDRTVPGPGLRLGVMATLALWHGSIVSQLGTVQFRRAGLSGRTRSAYQAPDLPPAPLVTRQGLEYEVDHASSWKVD